MHRITKYAIMWRAEEYVKVTLNIMRRIGLSMMKQDANASHLEIALIGDNR